MACMICGACRACMRTCVGAWVLAGARACTRARACMHACTVCVGAEGCCCAWLFLCEVGGSICAVRPGNNRVFPHPVCIRDKPRVSPISPIRIHACAHTHRYVYEHVHTGMYMSMYTLGMCMSCVAATLAKMPTACRRFRQPLPFPSPFPAGSGLSPLALSFYFSPLSLQQAWLYLFVAVCTGQ